MKKGLILIIGFALLCVAAHAQILKPLKWSFTAKKIKADVYEVHLTATIDQGWTTYSQTTPDGGPLPTAIKFKPNTNVLLGGKVKEVGEMKKKHEAAFGVEVFYYKDKVDFVQVVKLKKPATTLLVGTVEFMVCDKEQCLPPEEVEFSVELK
jgi:DsbC/DsbD-like thiol-disulfide interchange protein